MALATGFMLVALLGIFHHVCLRGLDYLSGRARFRPNGTVMGVFIGLLAIHTAEILAFAKVYQILLEDYDMGTLGGAFEGGWEGLIYFSGINFVTLGYTQIEAEGSLRLVVMMQSLGGFMILTWSATFIYSVWQKALHGD